MKIQFIGATEDVTGSMTLLETEKGKVLIDCGLYQGIEDTVLKNKIPLPFNAKDIKAIILTHAHLDHTGFIPRLVRLGFRGEIFCTAPTMKLAKIVLIDSAKILEKDKTHALTSFYEKEDTGIVTSLFKVKKEKENFSVLDLIVQFIPAGHILGACSAVIETPDKKRVVFSGDLGRSDDLLLHPPTPCPKADVVVLESTYGSRVRTGNSKEELLNVIKKIKQESKIGIVASFSIARGQSLIVLIKDIFREHPELKIPFVIDGPMMVEANRVYREFAESTKREDDLREALNDVEAVEHIREWKSLSKREGPLLVVSSSGMVTGGRIWRYLENWQDDQNTLLFLPGYQGLGTPGRILKEGGRDIVNEEVAVHWSGEVITSEAFSSHADQNELISWVKGAGSGAHLFLNHGDKQAKIVLKEKLAESGFFNVTIPHHDVYDLK